MGVMLRKTENDTLRSELVFVTLIISSKAVD